MDNPILRNGVYIAGSILTAILILKLFGIFAAKV